MVGGRGPPRAVSTPFVDETLAANDGVLGYLRRRNERRLPLCAAPEAIDFDPYYALGSHPDVVERLWKTLASKLSEETHCVVLGVPALADPETGLVLAVALGTSYAIRCHPAAYTQACEAGLRSVQEYTRTSLDAAAVFGSDWLFGRFHGREPEWLESSLSYYRGSIQRHED
jgi:hypothetical protein